MNDTKVVAAKSWVQTWCHFDLLETRSETGDRAVVGLAADTEASYKSQAGLGALSPVSSGRLYKGPDAHGRVSDVERQDRS
jgi:hypothetical protein